MSWKKSILDCLGIPNGFGARNESNRQDWLEKTLARIPSGSRILDAGAGELAQKKYCSHLEYIAQDFAAYDGEGDGKGLQTGSWDQSQLDIVSDITDIPEADETFDAILCVEVLEHLPEPLMAIKEFVRLLKPGGHLVLTAPFCSLTHFAPYHFYSGFNEYFYTEHLTKLGFEVVEITPNGNYYEYIAQEVRRTIGPGLVQDKGRPSLIDKLGAILYLRHLAKMSKSNTESHRTLCYGYHVLARKR